MDLKIENQLFVVCGATSGFGKAITERLLQEKAQIIIVARGEEKLSAFVEKHPDQLEDIVGDITTQDVIEKVTNKIGDRQLSGIVINAGGPPAKGFIETTVEDWDDAYQKLLQWKVSLTQKVLPKMIDQQYGRIVYVESSSVKQPLENLVLSNSIRLAVVGMAKTLSQEVADKGITVNVMAPGSHDTPALNRLFQKKAETAGITIDQARELFTENTRVGALGNPDDFASLGVWLLSPLSKFVTGQTISHAGGALRGTMG